MNGSNPGDRVLLHTLRRGLDLNGKIAIVQNDAPFNGRYPLQLEDSLERIWAHPNNFTRIRFAPQRAVDLEDESNFDESMLARGDCVLCLEKNAATRCVVPCGHLVTCDVCAPRLRMHGKCPVCRAPICDYLRVYLPGVKGGDAATHRTEPGARNAELETSGVAQACRQCKRQGEGRPSKRRRTCAQHLEIGAWVELPRLSCRSPLTSPGDVRFSGLRGEIVSMSGDKYVVRFEGVDHEMYVADASMVPGGAHEMIEFRRSLIFKRSWPRGALTALGGKLCVFPKTRKARADTVKRQRRQEQSRGDASRRAQVIE